MDSAQELYNKGLNQGWNRITVRDSDDLPESIKGDALWINPSLSRNGHNIPASYHALHEGDYYPVEFINGNWYWLDRDNDRYLGYWSKPKIKIPQGDKGLKWLGRESERPTLMPEGSFTTLRGRAESGSTQDQEAPVVPVEDNDFVNTNPAQSECYTPGLILCATCLSVLIFCYIRLASAYMYHRTALPLIPDIPAISILSCFRFTDVSWLACLFGPHFSRSCCPFDSYLPPLFLTRVSHFYSYDSDLFCSLLSTILHISQLIPGFLTRLLGLL